MLPVLCRFFFTEKFQPFRAAAFQNLLLICMSTMARLNLPGNSGAFPLKRLRISSCWKASEFSVKTGITVRMCNWHQSPTGRFLEWVEISAICREAGKKLAIFAVPPVVPAGRKGGSLFFFSKRFPSLLYFPFRMKMNSFFWQSADAWASLSADQRCHPIGPGPAMRSPVNTCQSKRKRRD